MDISTAIQGGGTLATIAVMWFMIKYFIRVVEKKDEQIQTAYNDFKTIITGHMTREEHAFKELTMSLQDCLRNKK